MTKAGLYKVELAKKRRELGCDKRCRCAHYSTGFAGSAHANQISLGYFERFPPSSQRGILEWIANAKREETRGKRIAETVRLAADNLKANHPAGSNQGPEA